MGTVIKDIATYIPSALWTNEAVVSRINKTSNWLHDGMLEKTFGIETRYYAEETEQVSDMAAMAAMKLLLRYPGLEVDLMIFASACSDMVEPSTSSIVHHKTGLSCPAFDVKNACNSFVNALHVANAFIRTGIYKNILIISAEKLSDSIRFDPEDTEQLRDNFAALSFGDAAIAAWITAGPENKGIIYEKMFTDGSYWDLCQIACGGSAYPRDLDRTYFSGKTHHLKEAFLKLAPVLVKSALENCQWSFKDINHVFTHQVSLDALKTIGKAFQITASQCENTFSQYGNTAAASIPLAMHQAMQQNKLKSGDKILILGLAAGINISIQCMIWP
jgi:3-oxoacyl-(acyl-carrier-protein) synthase III